MTMGLAEQSVCGSAVSRSTRASYRRAIIPLALSLIALAVRLFRIAVPSIWWDEAYSAHLARLDVPAAIRITSGDIHPPLYYILLHYWGLLGGYREYSIRLLSTVFSVALVILVYFWAREMFDERAGLWAMAVAALAPVQVLYSQEARMYTMLAFQYAALLYLLWRLATPRSSVPTWMWALLIGIEASLLYTHYFAAFGLVFANLALAAFWLVGRMRGRLMPWAAAQCATLLLFLPWLPIALRQTTGYVTFQPYAPGIPKLIAVTWQFHVSGLLGTAGNGALRSALAATVGWVLLGIVLGLFLQRRFRAAAGFLTGAFVVPVAFVLLAWQINPAVHPRYTIIFSPPLYLMLGRCLAGIWSRRFLDTATRAVLGLALLGLYVNGLTLGLFSDEFGKADLRSLASYIGSFAWQDDLILVDYNDYSLSFYYNGPARIEMLSGQSYEELQPFLQQLLADKKRCILLHRDKAPEWRGVYPFMMELAGNLVDVSEKADYTISVYEMNGPPSALQCEPTSYDFGALKHR